MKRALLQTMLPGATLAESLRERNTVIITPVHAVFCLIQFLILENTFCAQAQAQAQEITRHQELAANRKVFFIAIGTEALFKRAPRLQAAYMDLSRL